jgi:hypothetical protein
MEKDDPNEGVDMALGKRQAAVVTMEVLFDECASDRPARGDALL